MASSLPEIIMEASTIEERNPEVTPTGHYYEIVDGGNWTGNG